MITICPSIQQRRGWDNTSIHHPPCPPKPPHMTSDPEFQTQGCKCFFFVFCFSFFCFFFCKYAITTLNVLVMAADKNSCYKRLYIHIYIILILIVNSYSYYEANDCRLGRAEECVYLNSKNRRREVLFKKKKKKKKWYPPTSRALPRRTSSITTWTNCDPNQVWRGRGSPRGQHTLLKHVHWCRKWPTHSWRTLSFATWLHGRQDVSKDAEMLDCARSCRTLRPATRDEWVFVRVCVRMNYSTHVPHSGPT